MNFLSIIGFIFDFFKKDSGKTLVSYILVIVLGGFVFYQFYTMKKIENKNEELKTQLIIKNTKINNLQIKNKKLQDTIKVKNFEKNLTFEKLNLKSKIKNESSVITIKKVNKNSNEKNQTKKINSKIKDLKPGSYIIEIN
jgi:hypothetical protein